MMQPNLLTEYLGINYPKWLDGTNTGGSAFLFHVNHAYDAILNGTCDTVLILYGSMQKSQIERSFSGRPAIYSNQFDVMAGLPLPVGAYALAANRHMHQFGSNRETLAEIAVSTRAWANLNPNAAFRDIITIEDVLNSKPISSPLHRMDCCLVTDGGGAILITTEEKAKDLKTDPIYILGHGESASHSSINYMPDMSFLEVAKYSSDIAYNMAKTSPKDTSFIFMKDWLD